LISSTIPLPANTEILLRFMSLVENFGTFGMGENNNSVYIIHGTDTTWVWSANTSLDFWEESPEIELTQFAGESIKIAFVYTGMNNSHRWYVDDISVDVYTCPPPKNLFVVKPNATSARLTWEAGASETLWNLAYSDTQHFNPDINEAIQKFENVTFPFDITDLNPDIEYWFKVQANCGTEESQWTHSQNVAGCEVIATIGVLHQEYRHIGEAFNAINYGVHQGDIMIKVHGFSRLSSTATLYASGPVAANYTSVLIYPTMNNTMIVGDMNSALIDFSRAKNVTIDGRINGMGDAEQLTIRNESTGTSASTIRFRNSAEFNTIQYCKIQGSTRATTGGAVLFFSTVASGNGNSDNLIQFNEIGGFEEDQNNRPMNTLYCNGTAAYPSVNNTIRNNKFVNFIRNSATSYGVRLQVGSSSWTIKENSFYQTDETFTSTGIRTYFAIDIDNAAGSNFIIEDNYIGGREPFASGAQFNLSGTASSIFYGIRINAAASAIVKNNTITNIYHSSINNSAFYGISVAGAGIIDVEDNTIGNNITLHSPVRRAAATSTISGGSVSSITITDPGEGYIDTPTVSVASPPSGSGGTRATLIATVSGGEVFLEIDNPGSAYTSEPSITIHGSPIGRGIYANGSASIKVKNNNITGITTTGALPGSVYSFYGINSVSTGNREISGNTIGHISNPNSIHLSNATTDATIFTQTFYGIVSSTDNTNVVISNNTIANVTNTVENTTASHVRGIHVTAGANEISDNTIYNLSSNSGYDNATGTMVCSLELIIKV